jgi:SH3 domain protein
MGIHMNRLFVGRDLWVFGLIIFWIGWFSCGVAAATTLYISDTTLRANLRSGNSFANRITGMLRPGTQVTLIREEDGWAEVALEDGRRGWLLRKYLSERPAWQVTAQELAAENQRLKQQVSSLESNYQSLLQEKIELKNELDHKTKSLGEVQRAYEKLGVSSKMRWFLSGAGVLLLGWIFGFWRGRMRRRPRY